MSWNGCMIIITYSFCNEDYPITIYECSVTSSFNIRLSQFSTSTQIFIDRSRVHSRPTFFFLPFLSIHTEWVLPIFWWIYAKKRPTIFPILNMEIVFQNWFLCQTIYNWRSFWLKFNYVTNFLYNLFIT